jgi:hypothetical protein
MKQKFSDNSLSTAHLSKERVSGDKLLETLSLIFMKDMQVCLLQDISRMDILAEYQRNTFYGNQFFFHMERGRVNDS